ncbi:MAG: 4Fe-4S binding protein [Spirochaetaceae bacterium]|nr:MAG: 4Fe-4S binding protein [Spirochaetaceae bacterium]
MRNRRAPTAATLAARPARPACPAAFPAARWIPQIALLAVVIGGATVRNLGIAPEGILVKVIPELRALCPFGAVQALVSLEGSRLAIPLGVLLGTVILGAAFCGRLCPLGSVQEWIGRLGRRVLGHRYNRPVPGDRYLRHLRYALLAAILATGLGLLAAETDLINPSLALVHVWTAAVPITAVLVLLLVAGTSFFVERPWCRWVCPYGALLGTVARISPWTVRRDASTCIDCGRCDRACPLAIRVAAVTAVRDDRCNRCERCIDACPVAGALSFSGRFGVLKNSTRISLAVLLLFFTPFLLVRVAETVSAGAWRAAPPQDTIALAPDRVSPMMTLRDLAEEAGIAPAELGNLLGLPASWEADLPDDLMLIDLEEEPGLEHMTLGYIRSILAEEGQ